VTAALRNLFSLFAVQISNYHLSVMKIFLLGEWD